MNKCLLSLVALGVAVGCAPDAPTAPNRPASNRSPALLAWANAPAAEAASVSPPCQTVRGTETEHVVPGQASAGVMYGDLQGPTTTVLLPDPVGATDKWATGWVAHLAGQTTIEVESSSIPELVGRTITLTFDSRSTSPPPIEHVSNTFRVVAGATGNLESHGTLDFTTFTAQFDYEGVVCP